MSLHRACCCDAISLTCPSGSDTCEGGTVSAGLWCGCVGITPATSGRWGLCYVDPDFTSLSQSNPGHLLTRIAEGQYRMEEAGVRKMEFDYGAVLGGNDTYTIRGYLWESGAWSLKRTIGPTAFANDVRIGGYKAGTFGFGGSFKLWAIDEWAPTTITGQLFSLSVCSSCIDSNVKFNGTNYRARAISFNLTSGTLTRGSNSSNRCRYVGNTGTITCRLYDNGGDCASGDNLRHEVTVPIQMTAELGIDKQIIIEASSVFEDGTGAAVLTAFDAGGVAAQFNRAGETISGLANEQDCSAFTVNSHSDGGTATIIIPAHGS